MEVIINQLGNIEIIPSSQPNIEVNINPVPIKGDKGDKGDTGEQGIQGIQGEKGDEGLSAYEVAINNGFIGTEQEWLDFYLNRNNHIGTQSISTIEDLQQALDSKQPAGDYATNIDLTNGLNTKEPNIIQGTVNQYWRGDKNWQILDKNAVGLNNVDNTSDLAKPISTATQSVLDLKAPKDSPTFTGQLVLPNNSRINNTEHFYQSTKPISRGDGSALIAGDRWWKIDDGTEWFWNGTYWLSSQEFSTGGSSVWTGGSFGNNVGFSLFLKNYPQIFIKTLIGNISIGSLNNNSNYYVFTFQDSYPPRQTLGVITTQNLSATTSSRVSVKSEVNLAININSLSGVFVVLSIAGTPGAYDFLGVGLIYHLIA